MFGQCVIDFRVSRNGLFLASPGIEVDVVSRGATKQNTSFAPKLSDEFSSFHTAISFILNSSGTSSRIIKW